MSEFTLQPSLPGSETLYQCVGICMNDPDSGYCIGCGRPPEAPPTELPGRPDETTEAPAASAR